LVMLGEMPRVEPDLQVTKPGPKREAGASGWDWAQMVLAGYAALCAIIVAAFHREFWYGVLYYWTAVDPEHGKWWQVSAVLLAIQFGVALLIMGVGIRMVVRRRHQAWGLVLVFVPSLWLLWNFFGPGVYGLKKLKQADYARGAHVEQTKRDLHRERVAFDAQTGEYLVQMNLQKYPLVSLCR
jgi:hypothetical protein